MSLKPRKRKGTKKSGTKLKTFKVRFPHWSWGRWHEVEAKTREEAAKKLTGGTVYDPDTVVFEDTQFKGIKKADLERIQELGTHIEARTVDLFEKDSDERVEGISDAGYNAWGLETESGREYMVFADYKVAEHRAEDSVKEDFSDEPSLFNKDFVERHIDEEHFFRELDMDLDNWARDDVRENPEGYDVTHEDVEDESEAFEEAVETYMKNYKDDIRYQGIAEWLRGLGDEGKIASYVDVNELAKDAVNTDGWEHFLARYDGDSHELKDGSVYCRTN